FNSYQGHNNLLYSLGVTMSFLLGVTVYGLVGRNAFGWLLAGVVTGTFLIVQIIWTKVSEKIDKLLGNDLYPLASKYWKVISSHHEIKLSSLMAEMHDLRPAQPQADDHQGHIPAEMEQQEQEIVSRPSENFIRASETI